MVSLVARMAETARIRVWGREGHLEKARVASHARRRLIWKRLRDWELPANVSGRFAIFESDG